MKQSELKKILTKNGCYKVREGSNHEWWFSPMTSENFPVGRHNSEEIPTGTYNTILKQAGIRRK